jgi:hypothetical protein
MTLNDILMVTDPEVTIGLYENDDSHYIGAIKPLYALKCFNMYTIGAKVLNIKASETSNAIVVIINCEEK